MKKYNLLIEIIHTSIILAIILAINSCKTCRVHLFYGTTKGLKHAKEKNSTKVNINSNIEQKIPMLKLYFCIGNKMSILGSISQCLKSNDNFSNFETSIPRVCVSKIRADDVSLYNKEDLSTSIWRAGKVRVLRPAT